MYHLMLSSSPTGAQSCWSGPSHDTRPAHQRARQASVTAQQPAPLPARTGRRKNSHASHKLRTKTQKD